jgi:hypothetical protein
MKMTTPKPLPGIGVQQPLPILPETDPLPNPVRPAGADAFLRKHARTLRQIGFCPRTGRSPHVARGTPAWPDAFGAPSNGNPVLRSGSAWRRLLRVRIHYANGAHVLYADPQPPVHHKSPGGEITGVAFEGWNTATGQKTPVPAGMRAHLERTAPDGTPRCAFYGIRQSDGRPLEVDHKAGHSAWAARAGIDPHSPESYQLVCRQANQQKRQACKTCQRTGRRPDARTFGYPVGWTEGGETFDIDGAGCRGCFFHDPRAFRAALRPPT